jgi:DNA-binding transcriptional regulator of glucitol operon
VLWLLRPRWLAIHVLLVASVVTMVLLGRWQWNVAGSGGSGEGSLLNYGYALQWWAFAGFTVFFWTRLIRDQRRRVAVAAGRLPASASPDAQRALAEAPKPTPYRGYAMPQMAQITQSDPDLVAYNSYLGALNPVPALPGTPDPDVSAPAAEGER